ncbi:enoyl-CoA hydratase-related protein [Vicingaceae bacterium]|nr:enoyl-CoA hydratase-related protein [Vicingaceae bacterium]
MAENILVENDGSVQLITINRPDKLNALNKQTIQEIGDAVRTADASKEVTAIIITGSGEKAFVAGADISEFANFSGVEGGVLSQQGQNTLFNVVEKCQTPVIAAVNGFALGGGLELAMSCHIRIASDNAKMGLPEVTLGVIPGYGGTQRLAQLAGKGKAMELIMTAAMIDANEAHRIGLVNQVTTQEELLETAKKMAHKISRNSSVAISKAIQAINDGYRDGVDGFESEIKHFGDCFETADFKEGTTAFLEKRKPNFPGN